MIGFLILLVVLAAVCLVVQRLTEEEKRSSDLKDQASRAASAIDVEFHRTKRAMNDAAGQPWRNLVD